MRVALDDDQRDRRDAAAAFLGSVCRTADVRASRAAREAMSRDRWRQLAAMGLTSVAVAESFGGLGADDVDLVVLLEEVGHEA